MTEIWDFSGLIQSWTKDIKPIEGESREFPEVQSQLQTELNKLENELESLNKPSSLTQTKNNFLTTPLPPLSNPQDNPQIRSVEGNDQDFPALKRDIYTSKVEKRGVDENKSGRKIESELGKRPRPISQLTKPNPPTKIVKPRDPFHLHPARQIVHKVPHKFEYYFKANPSELKVVNYTLHKEYVLTFTLQNITSKTRGFQLIGPEDKGFSFRIIEGVENSQIRPGLYITFEVIFYPDEPRDYDSEFLFISGPDGPVTKVPIHCFRDPPVLSLPDIVDLNSSLLYSSEKGEFTITNTGGVATFSFKSSTGRESNDCYVDGPFKLYPSRFRLERGESIDIGISFSPITTGEHKVSFEIIPQYFPQRFYFISQAKSYNPSLKFSICNENKIFLPFLPHEVGKSKIVEIQNITDVEYPFHINFVQMNMNQNGKLFSLYPEYRLDEIEESPNPFSIQPLSGSIKGNRSFPLKISFDPTQFSAYKARATIYVDKIPDQKNSTGSLKMLTIDIEATSGSASAAIHPPLVIFKNVIPTICMSRYVNFINNSYVGIKMRWQKSLLITPNPLFFEVKPRNKFEVILNCLLHNGLPHQANDSKIFHNHPELTKQALLNEQWCAKCSYKDNSEISIPMVTKTKTRNYEIAFAEKYQTISDDSIQSNKLRGMKSKSCILNDNLDVPNMANDDIISCQPSEKTKPTAQNTKSNLLHFSYIGKLAPPLLKIEPPFLDFKCVLTGQKSTQTIEFINELQCPIGYTISYPADQQEWNINASSGIVAERTEISLDLCFENPISIDQLITINTFWCDANGNPIPNLPPASIDIPVTAIFDRPIVHIKDRIIDIGDVYPTLEYEAKTELELLNIFPTEYKFIDPAYSIELSMPDESTKQIFEPKQERFEGELPETGHKIRKENGTIIDRIEEETTTTVYEYTKISPSAGHLVPKDYPKSEVSIVSCFCRLGRNALPFICKSIGTSYRCAIIANVQPPKISLVTEKIDFSSDFVICNRSHNFVKIENECGVASTVQIRMIDNCNHVFSLDDESVFQIAPFGNVSIPVSCYSEIHGDYNGTLLLVIRDPWQHKEIEIPMHVKALGSFFGFKKHTLGYTIDEDNGDYVTFGEEIKVGNKKLIRRLTLENFSSESITVYWTLSNFVRGRKYANLNMTIEDNGNVVLSVAETSDANKQDPFSLQTSKSVIESHGKTVVVIEFDPKNVGEFNGCVAAQSSEFIHALGLHAVVIE